MKNSTRNKIQEAQYFLSMMKLTLEDKITFSYNLSAFLSAARSITWYIQKQYRHKDGFNPWYDSKKKEMKADRELNYLNDARIEAVKKESVGTGATRTKTFTVDALIGKKGTRGKGVSKQAEPKPAAQSESRTIGYFFTKFGRVDVVPFCESQLGKLTKLVEECEKRFQAKPLYHKEVAMFEEDAVAFWQFQSKLMWSRIQTATVIEAGVLGGWYQLWKAERSALAVAILLLGTALLLVVSLLMRRDSQYITACETRAGERMPKPGPPLLKLTGRRIAVLAPLLLAICNVVLAFTMDCFA